MLLGEAGGVAEQADGDGGGCDAEQFAAQEVYRDGEPQRQLQHVQADAAQREVLLFEFFLGVFEVHQRNRLMQAGRKMALASSSRPRARGTVMGGRGWVASRAIITVLSGFGLRRAAVEAVAQHFHPGFEVAQGAGALVLVAVLDVVVGVVDELQQLAAVVFAQLARRQLQVEQADVHQFGQVHGEQRAVGADFVVVAAQAFEVGFAVVAELFEQKPNALAVGTAAVLHRVFAQCGEVGMGAGEGLLVDGRRFVDVLQDAAVVAQPQPGQGGKRQAGHERQQPRHEVDFTAPKDAVDEARAEIEADECGGAVAPVARGQGFEGGEDGGHGVICAGLP